MLRQLSGLALRRSTPSWANGRLTQNLVVGLQQRLLSDRTAAEDGPLPTFDPVEAAYLHHGTRPRYKKPKFKSPRKKASKLFEEIKKNAIAKSKEDNPAMFKEPFEVGDAIEITVVSQGGAKPMGDGIRQEIDKMRGVVLGIVNRGLGSSVILRDVVFGSVIERKIPMHSPMIKDMKVLEKNFVFKGKRRVKRAKLYWLRDRSPLMTKVSKY